MKKILIATTALVATTGVALADGPAAIDFSGYARWGLFYDEGAADETSIESRYRINVDASTETDAGVRLAARFRIQADDGGEGGFNGARFQVSANGLRVRVGNISGAFDDGATVDLYGHEPGLSTFVGQYRTWTPRFGIIDYESTGAGANGINVLYEASGFAIMAAYVDGDNQDGVPGDIQGVEFTEIGVAYEFGDWSFGVAYGQSEFGAIEDDYWAATAAGSFGIADVTVFIADSDNQSDMSYGVSASFEAGANTDIIAAVAAGGDNSIEEVYGIGFKHDLGGGATLRGGIGQDRDGDLEADFGVRFDF